MDKIDIRYAEEKDSLLLLGFIRELAEYEKLLDKVEITEEQLIEDLFRLKRAYAFILFENNKPAGFALYYYTYSTFAGRPGLYLEDLFVKPEYRKRGYGKKLLAFLAKEAIRNNCFRVDWSVLNWNKPSIEFYKSIGADKIQDWLVFRLPEENFNELGNLV